jgi:hypothetical protein
MQDPLSILGKIHLGGQIHVEIEVVAKRAVSAHASLLADDKTRTRSSGVSEIASV